MTIHYIDPPPNANANDPKTGEREQCDGCPHPQHYGQHCACGCRRGALLVANPTSGPTRHARELANLRELLPEGATVWCVLRHRSRSGMERHVSALAMVQGERGQVWPRYLTGALVELCGYRPANNTRGEGAVHVRGVGFSVPDEIAGRLSRALYGSEGKLRGEWL